MKTEQVCDNSQNASEDSPRSAAEAGDYEKTRMLFEDVCLEIAKRYNLYYKDGTPRRAKIIEVIARTTCGACMDRDLEKDVSNRVDDLYKECHQQACNILVEELYHRFSSMGLTVLISTEKATQYCKADVLILLNGHGVSLLNNRKEVAVEIKTGYSLSLTQLYRYMLEKPDRDLVLWRIRNRQVLTFEGTSLKPLLIQFMRTFILRANRLLKDTETPCEHSYQNRNWSPSQQQLQEAFSDFSDGVVKTLPAVVETVVMMLDEGQIEVTEAKSIISQS